MEQMLIAAVRAVHFASAIVLFGQFVHVAVVAPDRQALAAFGRTAACSAVLLVASAVAWLGLEALSMSGLPLADALGTGTLAVVATQTLFGRVWIVRILLAAALSLVVVFLHRDPSRRALQAAGGVLAAVVLATIAGTGHAVAGKGLDRVVHLGADALHLLAVGAWLGALVPLIGMLGRADAAPLPVAAQATQRFSALGVASMAAIFVSGIVNAYYTLPDAAALANSRYGRMLLAKISLFLLILALATINRTVLMPRLAPASGEVEPALRRLRRNAIAECALGFGIVAIVGELGITVPGPHHH